MSEIVICGLASGGFFAGHLRAFLPRFGESDRDGLLAALYSAATATFTGFERATLLSPHYALHRFAGGSTVFTTSRFLS